jgi:hypothetical protein
MLHSKTYIEAYIEDVIMRSEVAIEHSRVKQLSQGYPLYFCMRVPSYS